MSEDEIKQLYLGGYKRIINNHIHRVASYDDLTSISFNLTDKDPAKQKDYDQRYLEIKGGDRGCFPAGILTHYYGCSYDAKELIKPHASGLLFSGTQAMEKVCVESYDTNYKINLTFRGEGSFVIPLAKASCEEIHNLMYQVEQYGSPTTSIASYEWRKEKIAVQLALSYEKIKITGEGRFVKGSHRVCVENLDIQEGKSIISMCLLIHEWNYKPRCLESKINY